MSYEIPIPQSEQIINQQKKRPEQKFSRRDFLKAAGAGGAALALGAYGIKLSHDRNSEKEPPEKAPGKWTPEEPFNAEEFERLQEDLRKESADMENDEKDVLGRTFREQLEKEPRVKIDGATQKALFEHWRDKYSKNEGKDITDCLTRMEPWMKDIRMIFSIYEVPEEFIYLAIAESNFRIGSASPRGAVGPYQIVRNLEKLDVNLTINEDFDERRDPLRSAAFCANHLKKSYEKFGKNWNLALMDYNGGFTNDYLEYLPEKELHMPEEELSVEGKYFLQKGDTVMGIAEKYGTSIPLLWRLNAVPGESYKDWYKRCEEMRPGDELLIPQKREIGEEGFYKYIEDRINRAITEDLSHDSYVVRRGDTWEDLAKLLHMDLDGLLSFNKITMKRKLKSGEIIKIPKERKASADYLLHVLGDFKENVNYPQKLYAILSVIKEKNLKPEPGNPALGYTKFKLNQEATPKDITRAKNIALENLLLVNPAIKNVSTRLKKGTPIRIPNALRISADKEKRKNIV